MSNASDARSSDASGRGTVDLDELERQLRQMAASRPTPRTEDPLADLARLVGRDDPFGGSSRSRGAEPVLPVTPAASEPAPVRDDPLSALERALQAGPRAPASDARVEPSFAPSPAPEPAPPPSPYAPSRVPAADSLQPAREALEAFLGRGPAAAPAQPFADEAVPAYRATPPEPETYPADPYQPAPYAIGSYEEPRASEPEPAAYAPPSGNPYGAAYGANAYHASASGGGVSSGGAPADAVYAPYGATSTAEPEPDFEPFVQRRSRKGLVTVAAVLGVGAIGVALALSLRGGPQAPSGEPPVIRAEGGPARVQPANPGGVEIPNQSKQIYERAANTPQGAPNVVDRSEQPVDLNQVVRSAQPRVVFPGNAPADGNQPAAGSASPSGAEANAGTGQGGIGALLGEPRRVRTVSVRPDGTIIGATEVPAANVAPAATPPSTQRPAALQANPAPAVVPTTPTAPRPTTPAAPVTTGSRQGQTGGDLSSLANAASQPLGIGGAPAASGTSPAPSTPNAAPSVQPKAQQRVTPPVAAPRAEPRAAEPIAIAPIIAAPAPSRPANPAPAAASGGGDFMVQLAAPGSEREARDTFAGLQRRFAGELGGMSPVIRRVDVGQRTIYRLRVGPMDRAEATALCERLKGAGGQCFIARN